jgi:hypothetical protein
VNVEARVARLRPIAVLPPSRQRDEADVARAVWGAWV